jgi:DNA-binding LytR/AlgR family response regulator
MNCLIVDDEPIARKGIREYVKDISFLNLVGECENGVKAASYLAEQSVDLIFLDINMPKISGIELLRNIKRQPLTILTTAFPEYALESYSLDVTDYLVKPIAFDRFLKACQKAFDIFTLRNGSQEHSLFFFVKSDSKYEKIFFQEVLYIKAMQNYAVIHTHQRKLITYLTMTSIENHLPKDQFIKVHKSYIIGLRHVNGIDGNELLIGKESIPVSRNLKDEVMKIILGNNLLKR